MGKMFGHFLDAVAGSLGSDQMKPEFLVDADSFAVSPDSMVGSPALGEPSKRRHQPSTSGASEVAEAEADHIPTIPEYFGVTQPLVVFVTPNYRDEPPSNAMLGELGAMQALAHLKNPDGSAAVEIARWIANGPTDLEGRLIAVDPLAGTRNNSELIDGQGRRQLHVRTDIERVVSVIVRFPVSDAQFAQIQTVFCTYGRPRLVADFSNAGLYMDMKLGPSSRERANFGGSAMTKPYSLKVLSQFDAVRVPNQRLADMIQRELEEAI
jgi:hypothetical protein